MHLQGKKSYLLIEKRGFESEGGGLSLLVVEEKKVN